MSDQKECPFCGESIKASAKKCRYCGEFLDGLTREQIVRDVTTGGGAYIVGNASVTDGDLVGRDKITIDLHGDNRVKQYETVIAAGRDWTEDRSFVGFDLAERNLVAFRLKNADLSNANLRGANLSGTDLRDANLVGADLSNANLTEADLSGAGLSWSNLCGANLTGANLTSTYLGSAIYDRTTTWPDGFDFEEACTILEGVPF